MKRYFYILFLLFTISCKQQVPKVIFSQKPFYISSKEASLLYDTISNTEFKLDSVIDWFDYRILKSKLLAKNKEIIVSIEKSEWSDGFDTISKPTYFYLSFLPNNIKIDSNKNRISISEYKTRSIASSTSFVDEARFIEPNRNGFTILSQQYNMNRDEFLNRLDSFYYSKQDLKIKNIEKRLKQDELYHSTSNSALFYSTFSDKYKLFQPRIIINYYVNDSFIYAKNSIECIVIAYIQTQRKISNERFNKKIDNLNKMEFDSLKRILPFNLRINLIVPHFKNQQSKHVLDSLLKAKQNK